MKRLSLFEKGFITGALDGEGAVGIRRNPHRNHRTMQYSPKLEITNTNYDFLTKAQCMIGGRIYPKKRYSPNQKQAWSHSENELTLYRSAKFANTRGERSDATVGSL